MRVTVPVPHPVSELNRDGDVLPVQGVSQLGEAPAEGMKLP